MLYLRGTGTEKRTRGTNLWLVVARISMLSLQENLGDKTRLWIIP